MKTLFKLAATALFTSLGVAPALAAPPANLLITAERGQPFSLVLDGRLLTQPVAPQVCVGMLAPGRHWAEFSVPMGYGPPMRFRAQVWLQPGLETDYVLVMRPYGPQLRQVGLVPLAGPGYGRGGYYGPGNVPYGAGPGGYYGNAQPPLPTQGDYSNGQYDPSYNPRGSYPSQGQSPAYPAPTPTPTYPGRQPQSYPAPSYPGQSNAPGNAYPDTADGGYYPGQNPTANLRPFAPDEIAGLAQDLRERPTDAERLRTATQALEESSLRAEELAELMHAFTHDESRIELARFGYAHLSNPQDFSRVYDALQFKSSIRTLRQAVGLPQE
ncbi:hypothetical protein GCM10023172_27410 [Hymenobacter ginsengisoli]|uniref:DUF4476 domain-containing protein n=1 Tax=Hymenobacter ginsengisoli TaxID=1051626 RepID=A0ABP8QGQ8_9BACT|nr:MULTISPECIES: DUF4476 domain-containing protein [unclassified Hymenobacter]MBO2030004.1 DUF4476 domain-containing protein [Hymenobacter sp. BT559]